MKAIIAIALLGGAGFIAKNQAPEVQRYLKAKKM